MAAAVPGAETNNCHRCQQAISTSQFIRVGVYKFHKGHFTCYQCNTDLHGQKFHHKDAQFFCADCFASKFCHECRHCKQKIKESHVIRAFGGFYHPEHFVCAVCEKPFENGKYYESNNQPYCQEHYIALTAEKCDYCKKPVKASDMVRAQSAIYHNACLRCAHCGTSLAGQNTIYQKDGKVYCQNDYLDFFCKRCTSCSQHIMKHCISVNSEFYHPECFKCSICSVKLEKYICLRGHLRCAEHSSFATTTFNCTVCMQPIDPDKVMLTCGKKLHDECLKCTLCGSKLKKDTAKLKGDALACINCLMKKDEKMIQAQLEEQKKAIDAKDETPRKTQEQVPGAPTSSSSSASTSLTSTATLTNSLSSTNTTNPQTNTIKLAGIAEHKNTAISSASSPPPSASSGSAVSGSPSPPPTANSTSIPTTASAAVANITGTEKISPRTRGRSQASRKRGNEPIEWKRGELIGKGSFGKVYMAMNTATGELIAVKQVKLNTSEDHEQAQQIQNEIALMENLRHRNIVALLGTQRVGNKLNIVMEYVPGKSLDRLLEKFGAFSEKVIKNYTKQLLSALAYCHANRVVHRDIKGKNILVDTQGHLKLADFGSAKKFSNALSKDAPSVSYNYTPLWTAPEVLVGDYNAKVDVWSLGCVIIEMATAKPPWSEENFENPFRALYHIGNSNAIPKIPDTLSELGKQFIIQCLQRDPDKRPTAQDLLSHKWLEGVEVDEGFGDTDSDDDKDNKSTLPFSNNSTISSPSSATSSTPAITPSPATSAAPLSIPASPASPAALTSSGYKPYQPISAPPPVLRGVTPPPSVGRGIAPPPAMPASLSKFAPLSPPPPPPSFAKK